MSSLIKQAIERRSRLRLRCKTESLIVEPYAFGIDSNGQPMLLCFQAGMTGMDKMRNGWEVIPLSELTDIERVSKRCKRVHSGYVRNPQIFHTVLIQI